MGLFEGMSRAEMSEAVDDAYSARIDAMIEHGNESHEAEAAQVRADMLAKDFRNETGQKDPVGPHDEM
ncbi:hypothetical protein U9R90_05275 [Streptomyces sp. E11-3]|uniref:hypothetical protein n=1 Tax=Streptomyces sp. E11-3 TaxID=3110112 RepID=UPI00398123AF